MDRSLQIPVPFLRVGKLENKLESSNDLEPVDECHLLRRVVAPLQKKVEYSCLNQPKHSVTSSIFPGEHSTPAEDGPPAGLRVRHQPRRQEALQAHREGDERAGQDHQRPAHAGRQPHHHRVRDEEAA